MCVCVGRKIATPTGKDLGVVIFMTQLVNVTAPKPEDGVCGIHSLLFVNESSSSSDGWDVYSCVDNAICGRPESEQRKCCGVEFLVVVSCSY